MQELGLEDRRNLLRHHRDSLCLVLLSIEAAATAATSAAETKRKKAEYSR